MKKVIAIMQSPEEVSPQGETLRERIARLKREQRARKRAKIRNAYEEETRVLKESCRENFLKRYGIAEEYEREVPLITAETRKKIEDYEAELLTGFEETMGVILQKLQFYTNVRIG